ncbi:MAG: putative membrane protein required for colicin V production [Candidatus Marinamargulisbacteria bacterium]
MIAISILIFYAYRGFKYGFVSAAFDCSSKIGSLLFALITFNKVSVFLIWVAKLSQPVGYGFGFFGCWLIGFISLRFVSRFVQGTIANDGSGLSSQIGGVVIGVAKGLVVIFIILAPFVGTQSNLFQESTMIKMGLPFVENIYYGYAPDFMVESQISFPDIKNMTLDKVRSNGDRIND